MSQNMTRTALLTSPLTGQTALMFAAPVRAFNKWLVAEGRSLQLGGGSDLGQFAAQLLLLFTVGLAVLALLWWQVDHRVLRPLSKLAERANRAVQDGAVGEFPLIQPHGEIGAVNRALHIVTSQLQHNAEQFETRISESLRTLDTIREVGQIISSMRDLDPLLNRAVALIQERFSRIYHVQVFLNDDRHEYAALRVSTGDIGRQLLARGHRLAVGSQSVIGRVTAEGRPVVALDTERTAFHRKNELLPDTRSELALPLRTVEGVIGALDVQSRLPDAFSEADIRLLQGIADQLAITIVNARLFQATRTQLAEIEHLNRRLLSESWQSFTDVRRRQAVESMSQPWSELQKRAMVTGTLVEQFSDDLVTFAVPVSLRGIVLGAVEWDMPRRQYSDDIRQLALELADRLAITADNARLFEETQQTAERERLVNEISARLTQQTDVSSILQIAVRDLGQALRVPQTAIRLGSSKPASQS
jgi:GAF domain-containing protein